MVCTSNKNKKIWKSKKSENYHHQLPQSLALLANFVQIWQMKVFVKDLFTRTAYLIFFLCRQIFVDLGRIVANSQFFPRRSKSL